MKRKMRSQILKSEGGQTEGVFRADVEYVAIRVI